MKTFHIIYLIVGEGLIVGFFLWIWLSGRLKDNPKSDNIIRLTSDDFEITEVLINGQFLPPGNFSEIVLPRAGMNCFAMQGTFNGKWNILYATGAVKIVAIPKSEFQGKGDGEYEKKEKE